ncbi:MAG: tetratricopeptide repeat protein [Microcoleaceae cyanobacterium]
MNQLQQKVAQYLQQGKIDEAIAICEKLLLEEFKQPITFRLLGEAFQCKGEFDRAKFYYLASLELWPDFAEAYVKLGSLYQQQKQWEEAIMIYQVATQIQPQNEQNYVNLGSIFQEIENLDQAVLCYQKAIQINSREFSIYNKLGKVLSQLERWNEAITVYQAGIELSPNFSWFYNGLGKSLAGLEKWEKATLAFQKSVELNPDFFWSYLHLSEALLSLKRWEDVIPVCHQMIRLNPSFDKIYLHLGKAFNHLQKWEEEISAYRQGLELNPCLEEFYSSLGGTLLKLGRWQEAAQIYHQAAELRPDCWWYPYLQGEALICTIDWQSASQVYNKAIALNPTSDWSYHRLGEVLEKLGQSTEAILEYKKVLELTLTSKNFSYYLAKGKIQALQGKSKLAIKSFIKSLQLNPDAYDIYGKIADVLNSEGRKQDAILCSIHQEFSQKVVNDFFDSSDNCSTDEIAKISIQKVSLYPSSQIKLSPPETFVPEQFHAIFRRPLIQTQEAFLSFIPEGRAWGSEFASAVFTSDHKLITDISSGAAMVIATANHLPLPLKLEGTVAFLSVKWGSAYYHWMFDIVARFALIEEAVGLENIDKFIVNSARQNHEKETLTLLGISLNKVLESRVTAHIQADTLIVPSPLKSFKIPNWSYQFLREKLLLKVSCSELQKVERIYISRSQASRRRVANEDEVVNFLEAFGFKKVILESMTVQQQICCLANAKIVVALHGGGLTNLVFCESGTKLIEFLASSWTLDCYWLLSNVCQIKYYQLLCQSMGDHLSEYDSRKDIYVEIKNLLQIMQFAEIL